ncbi:hypothetical protein ACHQM5_030268 [Ranunculus cassubicifolius]
MDNRLLKGGRPRPFTIHGELHHRIRSLLPSTDSGGSYTQLYIYDVSSALKCREERYPHLKREVLSRIHTT